MEFNRHIPSLFKPLLQKDSIFSAAAVGLELSVSNSCWTDVFGRALYDRMYGDRKIVTLSLFSGAGGLDIGFNDAGFDIAGCVEIESRFCRTLRLNTGRGRYFANGKVNCVDIRDYSPDGLPEIEFIIGGPPCQTFSAAGRRASGVSGTSDARGTLFREYVRILEVLKPQGFLFENVYGVVGAQGGKAWKEILDGFSKAGYRLFHRILDAADYGVPQHRERLVIVGLKDMEFLFPRPTHGPDSIDGAPYYTASQAIATAIPDDSDNTEGIGGRFGSLLNGVPPGLNYSFYTEEMGHPRPIFAWRSKFSDFLYKADPDSPVRTIKAQGGQYTGPFHWDNRRFSANEYKRLQTFPDRYYISGALQTQIRQIGNSVPPQFARIMALAIRQQVFGADFGFSLSYMAPDEELGFRKRKRLLTRIYRDKAKSAIEAAESSHETGKPASDTGNRAPAASQSGPGKLKPASYRYYAGISGSFAFTEEGKGTAMFEIKVAWDDDLRISVADTGRLRASPAFSLSVEPIRSKWNIPAGRILADCRSLRPLAFTASWKAVEKELARLDLKADLVQLIGYYQYQPKISCKLHLKAHSKLSYLLNIVNGTVTRRLISDSDFALALSIPIRETLAYAQKMRAIGYEIRNNHTNPQIKNGSWLIPYPFPTLTPLSVQLHKTLS
jgi:DNA (cytosine-5)-methyltransferase 1